MSVPVCTREGLASAIIQLRALEALAVHLAAAIGSAEDLPGHEREARLAALRVAVLAADLSTAVRSMHSHHGVRPV